MNKAIDFDAVADLYDSYVQTDLDIGFYIDLCKGRANILELMCGTGRVTIPLLRAGYHVTCVDYAERMLERLCAKLRAGDEATVVCQDVCDLSLNERYDLAMIPFHSFSEIVDGEKRRLVFERVYGHLLAGGTFFVSLYNPAHRLQTADGSERFLGRFALGEGMSLAVRYVNRYDPSDGTVLGMQYYEIYDEHDQLIEKRELPIRFAIISQQEMRTLARETGFAVRELYGDYAKSAFFPQSAFMHFLLEKAP